LSGISRGLGLDHVVGPDRPSPLQILELVPGLEWGGATLVVFLDHSTRLIEVLVDDAFGATAKFLTDLRHPVRTQPVRHQGWHLAHGEGVHPLDVPVTPGVCSSPTVARHPDPTQPRGHLRCYRHHRPTHPLPSHRKPLMHVSR
jgi:hypothetical protein